MKKLAIFDLDGTLLNTISDLGNACNYTLRKFGMPEHSLAAYNYMVGNGIGKLVERAATEVDPETLQEMVNVFREYYSENCTDKTTVYPGIKELLEQLREKDVALAVASNKYQSATEKIIKHYFSNIPFVSIQGQIEGRPIKPDPSVIFSILLDFPCKKSEIMFIGDSGVDIKTAKRACVSSVGVTWGFRPKSELLREYPDHICKTPSEIMEYLSDPF